MNRIYMDHAGTTPMRSEVLEAMLPYLTEKFGNASQYIHMAENLRKPLKIAGKRWHS